MSARTNGRRGFSGHRPTPAAPAAVVLAFTPANDWNVGYDDPPATDRTEVLLQDITATPITVASTTTIAGAGEADLVFVPTGGHSYAAQVRFSRDGEPGPTTTSNTVVA
jgi:hypothetical protein